MYMLCLVRLSSCVTINVKEATTRPREASLVFCLLSLQVNSNIIFELKVWAHLDMDGLSPLFLI